MSKITLILEAGASVEYGYPTGTELIRDIVEDDYSALYSEDYKK